MRKRPNNVDVLVGRRVRWLRTARRLSQAELARGLGVTYQQIRKYEIGANRIGAGRLFQIAGFLNVSIDAMYSEAVGQSRASSGYPPQHTSLEKFLQTRDGLALCHAFFKIKDSALRKKIIALVNEIATE